MGHRWSMGVDAPQPPVCSLSSPFHAGKRHIHDWASFSRPGGSLKGIARLTPTRIMEGVAPFERADRVNNAPCMHSFTH